MSYTPGYKPGDWKANCDVCGFTFKASELKDRWDGLKVCDKDWEQRHPMDFIKGPEGEKPLPWTRPEPEDRFVTGLYSPQYLYLPGIAGNYASTPHSAGITITGDIDIIVRAALDDWQPVAEAGFISKQASSPNIGWTFNTQTLSSGRLEFRFSTDGTTQTAVVSSAVPDFTDRSIYWVRVTRTSTDGSVNFYTSNDGVSWAQLGTTQAAAAGSMFASTAILEIGATLAGTSFTKGGKIYYAELRSGVGGTAVAKFDPFSDAAAVGDTSFTSSTSEVWTINQSGSNKAALQSLMEDTIPTGHNDGSL